MKNRPVSLRVFVAKLPILAYLKHLAPQEVLYSLVAEFTTCFPSLTLIFPVTWTRVATGVLVPDGRLAERRGTHFSVAQDATLPAGAACALVQVPRLALHVKFPPGGSAHHHVHPVRLTAA